MAADLRTELRLRAERTAESIMDAARAEADRLASEADRRIEDRRRAVLGKKDRELRTEARAQVAAERHAAMRAVLLAKTKVVDRVLHEARRRLPEAARSRAYASALGKELRDAVAFVGEQGAVVRCSDELRPAVLEAARDLRNMSVEAEQNADSGFKVIGKGGSLVVDGTLETRLDRLGSILAIEIHKRLEEI
ncbi:MAG: hypothetical protein AMJ62_06210 [Myxococcales bacterium SG8_38]|nr:MAG: hypothetical protein AMJ62_06210 [Myxococcales bacterium SG8_38]